MMITTRKHLHLNLNHHRENSQGNSRGRGRGGRPKVWSKPHVASCLLCLQVGFILLGLVSFGSHLVPIGLVWFGPLCLLALSAGWFDLVCYGLICLELVWFDIVIKCIFNFVAKNGTFPATAESSWSTSPIAFIR